MLNSQTTPTHFDGQISRESLKTNTRERAQSKPRSSKQNDPYQASHTAESIVKLPRRKSQAQSQAHHALRERRESQNGLVSPAARGKQASTAGYVKVDTLTSPF